MPRTWTWIALLITLGISGCSAPIAEPESPAAQRATAVADTGYAEGPLTRGGTGRYYMGREIARVMGHEGAAWLERPERERTEMPDAVVDSLRLAPTDHVADIGAGTGYFTTRIARRVPRGLVYAVDVQAEMLAMLEGRLAEAGVRNVVAVLGEPDNPHLPPNAVDVVLIVDAYHEFAYPREMLQHIHDALRPGGRLVLLEYRAEDSDIPIHPLHRMSVTQAQREVEAGGFRLLEVKDFLPMQHFLVFGKMGSN